MHRPLQYIQHASKGHLMALNPAHQLPNFLTLHKPNCSVPCSQTRVDMKSFEHCVQLGVGENASGERSSDLLDSDEL